MATKKNEFSLGGLIALIIVALIVWFILPASWTDPFLYSTEYSINTEQVHWNAKPTDCDWGHAPLGDKGCHYKKTVTLFNAAGDVVTGKTPPTATPVPGAPRYAKNTYGDTIISYDDGKTWKVTEVNPAPRDWLGNPNPNAPAPRVPDPTVKRVEIDWVKVED